MKNLVVWLWLGALLSAASIANGGELTKELSQVTFDDGGTASGFLTLDTDSRLITDFDIVTTSGSTISTSFDYLPTTAHIGDQSNAAGSPSFVQLLSLAGGRELFLAFSEPFSLEQTSFILYTSSQGEASFERQTIDPQLEEIRWVAGPQVAPSVIPESSQMTFVLPGIILAYAIALRRRCAGRFQRCA